MPRLKAFDEEVVLHRAMEVFWKNGYHATSMEELVQAMGINRASMYDTFGDKKTLYMRALVQYQSMSNRSNQPILLKETLSPKNRIIRLFEMYLSQSLLDPQHRGCMIANATAEMDDNDIEIRDFLQKNKCMVEGVFEQLIKQGQKIGEIPKLINAKASAVFLSQYLNGMKIIAKISNDPKILKQSLKIAMSTLD
jgi:TetR/AcrR family transcriptional regulator, transcriptional repressor for nem operon